MILNAHKSGDSLNTLSNKQTKSLFSRTEKSPEKLFSSSFCRGQTSGRPPRLKEC